MSVQPWGRKVVEGRDPEEELRDLQRRFNAISRRHDRARKWRGFGLQAAKAFAIGAAAGALIYLGWLSLGPDPDSRETMLRHLASYRNCDAARAVGLAPARRGEPGYWPQHDADNDGWSCEPMPVVRRMPVYIREW